jgi:phage RecT family recombinase
MNAITPFEAYRQQVLPPDKASDLFRSLPMHIKPATFERNLLNAIMQNPDLMKFDPRLVFREVCKAAALGILLDPQLREGYIVPAYNYRSGKVEPQLRIGYVGLCKLARQAGGVTNIYAHEVYANDKIICQLGTDKKLVHEPDLFSDRGAVVGYYAVIKFADGNEDFEPMSVQQARDIRDRSDAWKAFQANKIKSTPWQTDEIEMSKKTVLRRLLKRQPQSPELAQAIDIEDKAEFPHMREVNARPALAPASGEPPSPDEIDNAAAMAEVEAGRSEPGEIVWSDEPPAPDTVATAGPAPKPAEGDGLDIPAALDRRPLKAQLLELIGKLQSSADCRHLAGSEDFYERTRPLSEADRDEVNMALSRRQYTLRQAGK